MHTVLLEVISLDSDKVLIVKLLAGLLTQHTVPRGGGTLWNQAFLAGACVFLLTAGKYCLFSPTWWGGHFWVPNKRMYLYRICMKIALNSMKARTVLLWGTKMATATSEENQEYHRYEKPTFFSTSQSCIWSVSMLSLIVPKEIGFPSAIS